MLIVALLTAITAIAVQALAKDPSRQDDPYVTANAGFPAPDLPEASSG